jgi:hypothetical protein
MEHNTLDTYYTRKVKPITVSVTTTTFIADRLARAIIVAIFYLQASALPRGGMGLETGRILGPLLLLLEGAGARVLRAQQLHHAGDVVVKLYP